MKNIFRKTISVILALAMVYGVAAGLSLGVSAAETFTENGYTYTVTDETATVTDCGSVSGEVVIPETLGGYPVTALDGGSFHNAGVIDILYIHSGITDIFGYPYSGYRGLFSGVDVKYFTVDEANPNYSSDESGVLYNKEKTVLYQFPRKSDITHFTVPHGVTKIDCFAFRYCQNLEWFDTEDTVEEVSYGAFTHCEKLVGFDLGYNAKIISTEAFAYCYALRNVNVGRRLEKIYEHAFWGCDGIREFSFPRTLNYVSDLAFYECSGIEKFTVASGGETFSSDENGVLYGDGGARLVKFPPASKLTEYEIPETVTTVGSFAFGFDADNIVKVTGGSGLELIGSLAFASCESLEEVILDNGEKPLTLYNEVFAYSPRLRRVVFPDNFTTAKYSDIFSECYNIESVTVGSSLAEAKFMRSPVRDGCDNLGWFANGVKAEYPYATNGERITLTAMFEPMNYGIILSGEGGAFEGNKAELNLSCAPGEKIENLPEPVLSGFEFDGWDGMPENGIMPEKSITLKAKWKAPEETDETLSIRAELLYFDEESGEWLVTEKITDNESLKLRVYIDTTYYTSSGKFVLFYEDHTYGENYEEDKIYALNLNTDPQSTAVKADAMGSFTVAKPGSTVMRDFLAKGYIDEEMSKNYWAMLVDFRFGYHMCQKISGETWFAEFDFNTGWKTNMGTEFYLLDETVASVDNPDGYTDIPVGMEKAEPRNTVSLAGTKINTNLEGTLGDASICYEFHAGDGKFANGTWNIYAYSSVGRQPNYPGDPVREGYTFVGWVDQYGNPAEVPEVLGRRNYAFFAVWDSNAYEVHFETNSPDKIPSETYDCDEEIASFSAPAPKLEGFTFDGWRFEDGTRVEFPLVMPADDVTVYASWTVNKYNVKYIIGDKSENFTVAFGSEIPVPDMTAYENVDFVEWRNSAGEKVTIPQAMPSNDLEFVAKLRITEVSDSPAVSAEYDDDCFSQEVKLSVTEIDGESKSGNVYLVEGQKYYQVGYMNIKMLNDKSEPVQPENGKKVRLRIPVPEKYAGRTDFIINHWFTNGGREQLRADRGEITVENGYICFEVGRFSEFEIYVSGTTGLKKAPAKLSYYYKEELDLSGIELSIINPDGTAETVTDTSEMKVSGYDPTKIGEQTVTVEYEGETVEFKVTVRYAWWQWIIRILLLGFLWY
ncbi:MAG: leucine-rich repeat protein [Clostridia bacterium]|nr:leucine-rich repeat protein [Clostridia bacterium]